MSCKFCDVYNPEEITTSVGDKVQVIPNSGLLAFDNSWNEHNTGSVEINYCPFCGRNLNEE